MNRARCGPQGITPPHNKKAQKSTPKRIFVYIETQVQFDSIEPLLAHFQNSKIPFDIVVRSSDEEDKEIFVQTAKYIKKKGFSIHSRANQKISRTKYQIVLSPYMHLWLRQDINAKYYLQYSYTSYYFHKPSWNVGRLLEGEYLADAILTHAVGTQDAVDVVSRAHITPELRFIDFHKKVRSGEAGEKPTILFMPTYNEMDFAVRFLEAVDTLKENYQVALRGHHRALYLDENKGLTAKLHDAADIVFDPDHYTVKDALEHADLVISDNSSAFLEAINLAIPVVLFSQDPNVFKYRDIDSIQHHLIQNGTVLWTSEPRELPKIIAKTLSRTMIEKQEKLTQELFPDEFADPVGRYMEVLNIYLNDELPEEYYCMKKYWLEKIEGLISENDQLNAELASHMGIKRSARLLAGNIKRRIQSTFHTPT
jgi:hypothetical protein